MEQRATNGSTMEDYYQMFAREVGYRRDEYEILQLETKGETSPSNKTLVALASKEATVKTLELVHQQLAQSISSSMSAQELHTEAKAFIDNVKIFPKDEIIASSVDSVTGIKGQDVRQAEKYNTLKTVVGENLATVFTRLFR